MRFVYCFSADHDSGRLARPFQGSHTHRESERWLEETRLDRTEEDPSADIATRSSGTNNTLRPRSSSSVTVLRAILGVLENRGVPASRLLVQLEATHEMLDEPDARIPFDELIRAWELASILSCDEDFGLHFGEQVPSGSFEILDYVARSCNTLGDALERLSRYQRLLHSAVGVTLQRVGDMVEVEHVINAIPAPGIRQAAEAAISSYVTRARSICSIGITVEEVRFAHPEPRNIAEHQRIFQAPIAFGCRANGLTFHSRYLEISLVDAEPRLRRILDAHASLLLQRIPADTPVMSLTARAIMVHLSDSGPLLDNVARQLGRTSRTLQRQLRDEGTSFLEQVRRVRQELAIQYLETTDLTIQEISHRLGFSEPSAFHRAFRRWTGSTPASARVRRRTA